MTKKSLYARLVLALIRPALKLHTSNMDKQYSTEKDQRIMAEANKALDEIIADGEAQDRVRDIADELGITPIQTPDGLKLHADDVLAACARGMLSSKTADSYYRDGITITGGEGTVQRCRRDQHGQMHTQRISRDNGKTWRITRAWLDRYATPMQLTSMPPIKTYALSPGQDEIVTMINGGEALPARLLVEQIQLMLFTTKQIEDMERLAAVMLPLKHSYGEALREINALAEDPATPGADPNPRPDSVTMCGVPVGTLLDRMFTGQDLFNEEELAANQARIDAENERKKQQEADDQARAAENALPPGTTIVGMRFGVLDVATGVDETVLLDTRCLGELDYDSDLDRVHQALRLPADLERTETPMGWRVTVDYLRRWTAGETINEAQATAADIEWPLPHDWVDQLTTHSYWPRERCEAFEAAADPLSLGVLIRDKSTALRDDRIPSLAAIETEVREWKAPVVDICLHGLAESNGADLVGSTATATVSIIYANGHEYVGETIFQGKAISPFIRRIKTRLEPHV